ncbi:hypothetical protein FJZ22_00880 [Candidatus Pacearchaeota archaeon]|nr:hypothetical protein [Candidatus Pacearchaeota archaeon]
MSVVCYARPGEPVQFDETALRKINAQFQEPFPHEAFRLYEGEVDFLDRDVERALPYLAGGK